MLHLKRCGSIFIAGIACLILAPHPAYGRIVLLDGQLELSGYAREYYLIRTHIPRAEQQFHNSNMDMALSSFLLEGLYKIADTDGRNIHFFCGLRYWYEKAAVFDSKLRDGIPAQAYNGYLYPRTDEIVNEAILILPRDRCGCC